MNAKDFVSNKPEMLIDYNGHAMQLFCVGGESIFLGKDPIRVKTSVFRVCNNNPSSAILDINGNTITILGNHCHVFSCMIGDRISCPSSEFTDQFLEIVFWRDKTGY